MKEKMVHTLSNGQDSVELVAHHLPDSYEAFMDMDMDKLERDGIYKNIEYAIQNILDSCALLVKEQICMSPPVTTIC